MIGQLKVCIVDDNKYFRDGLRFFIETQTNWDIIRENSSGKEFLESELSTLPDIVFMDINMPDLNGIETTSRFFKKFERTSVKVLALTMYSNDYYKQSLIEAGFSGCVLKRDIYMDLKHAVEEIESKGIYFNEVTIKS